MSGVEQQIILRNSESEDRLQGLQNVLQNREQFLTILKQKKEKYDQMSSIEFLSEELKWKEDSRKLISSYIDNYLKEKPNCIIRQQSNCLPCLFKRSSEIGGFKKSWSKCDEQEDEKRFYGNIYFDNQDLQFMISQTLKVQDFEQLEEFQQRIDQIRLREIDHFYNAKLFKKILQFYDNDEINLIINYNRKYGSQLNYQYEDMNSDYLYGKRCEYGFEITKKENVNYIYIGEFFNNKYHGKGVLLQEPFYNSEGEEFFAGKKEKELFYFLHGIEKEGQNVVKQEQDIGYYHGEMSENKRNGCGILKLKNGNQYKGQWQDNKMHGMGHFTWGNGEEYLGEYFQGIKHGFGRYKYQQNKIYLGQFKDGKQHGLALVQNSSKLNLYTEWRNGQLME
ncbi:unnamed protein product [Paramecium primaurelia]|uniref:Uncharacterized protein n=1 Tax=Paramecium primaurelia TaxID=5886 RepID=A0A8S1QCD6_PARPR|nr:unnamed protein product [Paramecium primaurelia]